MTRGFDWIPSGDASCVKYISTPTTVISIGYLSSDTSTTIVQLATANVPVITVYWAESDLVRFTPPLTMASSAGTSPVSTSPVSTSTTQNGTQTGTNNVSTNDLSLGAKAGIGVSAGLAGLCLLAGALFLFLAYRKRRQPSPVGPPPFPATVQQPAVGELEHPMPFSNASGPSYSYFHTEHQQAPYIWSQASLGQQLSIGNGVNPPVELAAGHEHAQAQPSIYGQGQTTGWATAHAARPPEIPTSSSTPAVEGLGNRQASASASSVQRAEGSQEQSRRQTLSLIEDAEMRFLEEEEARIKERRAQLLERTGRDKP